MSYVRDERRHSNISGRTRRSSSFSSRSSASVLAEENNNSEVYAGAASEVIPSSITSLHYPHSLREHRNRKVSSISRETSPLIEPQDSRRTAENDEESIVSNDSLKKHAGFRFFSVNDLEMAPGGSTLENPDDPVDYNTDWEYSVNNYVDDDQSRKSFLTSPKGYNEEEFGPTSSLADIAGEQYDMFGRISSATPSYHEPSRRGSAEDSDKDSGISLMHENVDESARQFSPSLIYQRYYLAEEDLVIGIAGYKNCFWKKVLYNVICFVTFGIGYLILRWFPKLQISLKGNKSPLGEADWCVVENEHGELSIVNLHKQRFNERLSNFLVVTKFDNGVDKNFYSSEDVRLKNRDADPVIPYMITFNYRYLKFFYNPVEDIFKTNSNWYDGRWLNFKETKEGLTQTLHDRRMNVFGSNSIELEEKSVFQLLVDEVLHPFYIFQVFSILLWLADDYVNYATCIFLISAVSIVNTLYETKTTIKRLQEMSKYTCDVRVWRNGFWKQVDSTDLVPGDLFEADPSLNILPCDALLVNGECVVNESMLTGESVPVLKVKATSETLQFLTENFTSPLLAKSLLYNGTKLLKMRSPNDEPVTALVVKTGFNTTKGSLVRSMLFPRPIGFKFYRDSFRYIGFMALIALIGFIYSTYNFIKLGVLKKVMILRALDLITIIVPPALPASLTIGQTFAINRLKKELIFCVAPTRVNVGGKIDAMCFDKTGTLTEDGLDVLGVHLANNASGRKEIIFEELVSDIKFLNTDTQTSNGNDRAKLFVGGLATCHSLRLIDEELMGDPLDFKMFEFSKWHFREDFNNSNSMVFPKYESDGFKIIKEFEFVSSLRRMSVQVSDMNDKNIIFTKGAPEALLEICRPESVPLNYEEVLHYYTHHGYRVIALAQKVIENEENPSSVTRQYIENDLTFSGFIVFENKIKKDTRKTLEAIKSASIRTIMCTGDNLLTAVSVARECGIFDQEVQHIYVPNFVEGHHESNLIWEEISSPDLLLDLVTLKPLVLSNEIVNSNYLSGDYRLAITGDVFRYLLTELKDEHIFQQLLLKCDVYSRMSPDEKHELVEQLQKLDYTVSFCGDGANDCGALKGADVGISLSEAEASVAAPFTSKNFEISCVLDVIREGRACLVTSFSCFKYMSSYSAIQFVSVTILYKRGTNLGDFQFLYIDLFLILPLALFMSWSKPYHSIVRKKPTANLVSPKILISLCGHILILAAFQILVWSLAQIQPYYKAPIPGGDDLVKSTDNTVLFLYSNFQYIIMSVAFNTGPPYREPFVRNYAFLINLALLTGVSLLLCFIDENSSWGAYTQLTNLSSFFYLTLIIVAIGNLILTLMCEESWFRYLTSVYKRHIRGYGIKSKKLYKVLGEQYGQLESV